VLYDPGVRRQLAFLSCVLFASCASNGGFEGGRLYDCAPGQIVTLQAGFDDPRTPGLENMDDQHVLIVLVGNNSQEDLVVKSVRVDPVQDDASVYRIDSAFGSFDETVAEGEEGEFKIRLMGRYVQPVVRDSALWHHSFAAGVSVALTNGDVYRCRFEFPVK
jgi:hypothetical protein